LAARFKFQRNNETTIETNKYPPEYINLINLFNKQKTPTRVLRDYSFSSSKETLPSSCVLDPTHIEEFMCHDCLIIPVCILFSIVFSYPLVCIFYLSAANVYHMWAMSQIAHVRVPTRRVTWELIRERLDCPGIYFISTLIGGQDKRRSGKRRGQGPRNSLKRKIRTRKAKTMPGQR